ncbi:MAG: beta-N-acetylhexosaminidase [Bacteroidaceae bacterium]|nr:beta-N-acetylhexosaminidase [Bacteroidaceae bacterium]
MKRTAFLILALAVLSASHAARRADYRIIPLPKSVQTDSTQVFTLSDGMGIAYDSNDEEQTRIAGFLAKWVKEATGLGLTLTPADSKAAIRLAIGAPATKKGRKAKAEVPLTEQQKEAYTINVSAKGITLQARQGVGLFRAAQTLRKSLPAQAADGQPVELPYTTIQDEPRFVYRGVLLDCARHFFSMDVLKQYLDMMALHGCNQFHWHLTEDQGWRFEVKAIPELATKGSIRQETVVGRNTGVYDGIPYGGYYSQQDCRDLVRYAAERYINVIPEIDLPGHMQGALHVLPHLGCTGGPYPVRTYWGVSDEVLCAGNPQTMDFLRTVLGELCDVFPSKYIHIGGDECPKKRWKACPKCQAKIKELGLKDDGKHSPENQLQTWVNQQVEQFLAERGRDIIGWDEILEGGLSGNSIVMSWRGTKGGIEAAKQHHRVIMSPNVFGYIDHPQYKDEAEKIPTAGRYIVSCSKIYSFEPLIPEELQEDEQQYVLGPQTNLWTEHVAFPQHLFYMLLPRLGAMSEVQWCRPDQKDFQDFRNRLTRLTQLYDRIGIKYCRQIE